MSMYFKVKKLPAHIGRPASLTSTHQYKTKLTPRQREAYDLNHKWGMSLHEISIAMDISVRRVVQLMHAACRKVKYFGETA